jgi:hypothetical protein
MREALGGVHGVAGIDSGRTARSGILDNRVAIFHAVTDTNGQLVARRAAARGRRTDRGTGGESLSLGGSQWWTSFRLKLDFDGLHVSSCAAKDIYRSPDDDSLVDWSRGSRDCSSLPSVETKNGFESSSETARARKLCRILRAGRGQMTEITIERVKIKGDHTQTPWSHLRETAPRTMPHPRILAACILLSTIAATTSAWSDSDIPLPSEPLKWGEVNFIATTDTHGV